jgi:hypothetical protein
MASIVMTGFSSVIHLRQDETLKTNCGLVPYKNAPKVIHRYLMCMNCFGVDHGAKQWTAEKLGVEKIYEPVDVNNELRRKVSVGQAKRRPIVTLPKVSS